MTYLAAFTTFILCFAAHPLELTGSVYGPNDTPLADADVWISQHRKVWRTATGPKGKFGFEGISEGPSQLVALKDGYAVGGLNVYVVGSDSVRLDLSEPDTVTVSVINVNGESLAGARLKAVRVNQRFDVPVADLQAYGFPSARSDEGGTMAIPYLPRGGFVSFAVDHRDYAQNHIFMFPVGHTVTVVLHEGLDLRGRVTNIDGRGVEGARVSVFRVVQGQPREKAEALTDAEGFYATEVEPGQYQVAITHPEYATTVPQAVLVDPAKAEHVFDVTMPDTRRITGVVKSEDGDPMPAVPVAFLLDGVLLDEARSRADGTFTLLAPPAAGIFQVYPPAGYMTEELPYRVVQPGDEKRVRLGAVRLRTLPAIEGVVLDPDGDSVEGVWVQSRGLRYQALTRTPNQSLQVRTLTGEDGRFSLQLERTPEAAKATFVAEHPLRFWRREFDVSFEKAKTHRVKLRTFKPDLRETRPDQVYNPMGHMAGDPAPALSCEMWFNLPEGRTGVTLEALKGTVVVLAFWGGFSVDSGAGDALNELKMLYEAYRDVEDVAVISVHDSGKTSAEIRRYIEAFDVTFPVGRDADPFLTFDAYNIARIPQIVLIGKEGILRYYDTAGRVLELVKALRRE